MRLLQLGENRRFLQSGPQEQTERDDHRAEEKRKPPSPCIELLRREMRRILRETFSRQDMTKNNQHPQVFLRIRTEKRWNPTDSFGAVRISITKRLKFA